MTIDDMDRRILNRLQHRSDEPLDALGEAVGLSRNAVWRRIKSMETRGILIGRIALIDPATVGLSLTVFIQIRSAEHSESWLRAFQGAVRTIPEIQGAYRMTGDLDYLLKARVADMADYDRLYQRLISAIDVTDLSASFVMESIKETSALPL